MNTTLLNQNPSPHNLEFTHNLDSHEYLQTKQGYKGVLGFFAFSGLLFTLSLVEILFDRNDHLPLDYGTVMLWCFSIATFFLGLYLFPLCQQTNPDKAILWLPAHKNNPQDCLHIRSKNWHYLSIALFLFFLVGGMLCAAYDFGSIPPTQALQPWNWIRITPINLKADLMCLTADIILILFTLIIIIFPQWHIIYTSQTLHIYHHFPLLHRTTTHLNHSWEQLATTSLIQSNVNNPSFAYMRSTITLKNGQEKTFKLPAMALADPCWMNFIATTLTQLPGATSRQNFLTNLHQYVPPKAKTRNTKP